jgi:RNA polymerase sporulation-specific sigma factor
MLKAIRSFDLDRGTSFSTYAVPLIFGEIRRHLRDEGPIKIGRYYKKIGASLMREKSRILTEEGREARISELAEICSVSIEEAAMAIDSMSPMMSLSDLVFGEEDGVELEDMVAEPQASSEMEKILDKIALGQAVAKMPSEWQKIVILRYYRNCTQQKTADILGLSQVKVSREEKKILDFLRAELLR